MPGDVERGRSDANGITVLLLNAFASEGMGGGEVQTLHLIRGLLRRGAAVHLMCPPGELADSARESGAAVSQHSFGAASLVTDVGAVRDVCRAAGARIVHGTGYLTNMLARRARVAGKVVVVNTVHVVPGAALHESGSRLELAARTALDRLTLRRCDALVAVSEAVAEGLRAARLVPPSGVRVIPNGIDVDALVAASREEAPLGIPPGEGPLVGFLGRLERVKGPDVFVEVCRVLASRRQDLRFAIAGSGSLAGETERGLRAACGDRAAFLGHVSNAAAFLSCLDALVVPSRSESFSLVALEAMAIGTPIVATAVGGLADLLRESGAGILAPPEDPPAVADAVERLLADPVSRERMREAGKAYARRYSVDRMVDGYLDMYRAVLAGLQP